MKKQLFLQLLLVAFSSLVYGQSNPEKNYPLKPNLNPNTDSRNQQTPNAPAPASVPAEPRSNQGVTSGGQSKKNTPSAQNKHQPAQETTPPPVPAAPAVKTEPATMPPQTTSGAEKPAMESPAAAAKRQLIADGYKVCMTHPDYGKVYCKDAADTGSKPTKSQRGSASTKTYYYIDEDGIATPLDRKLVEPAPEKEKEKLPEPKAVPAPQMVRVNRWVSPVFGDFVTIPEDKSTDAALRSWGYKDKIFQYEAFLTRPEGDNVAIVNRWEMPNCKDFVLMTEHMTSDAKMIEWGFKNKQFVFYAYKTRPASGNYVAVNRWINTLPAESGCREFTLSVTETELTDAQLLSWGYTGKILQFYVPAP